MFRVSNKSRISNCSILLKSAVFYSAIKYMHQIRARPLANGNAIPLEFGKSFRKLPRDKGAIKGPSTALVIRKEYVLDSSKY